MCHMSPKDVLQREGVQAEDHHHPPPLWSSVTEEQTLLSGYSRAFSPVPDLGPPDRQPAAQQQVRRGILLITGRSTGLFCAKSWTMEVHYRHN